MLVKIISISLITALLFKPMLGFYMVLDYELNKDYFAAYLCENKDRPELACEGKCFLMQKLEHNFADKRSAHQHMLQQLTKIEIMDVPMMSHIAFGKIEFFKAIFELFQHTKTGFVPSIFQPPSF